MSHMENPCVRSINGQTVPNCNTSETRVDTIESDSSYLKLYRVKSSNEKRLNYAIHSRRNHSTSQETSQNYFRNSSNPSTTSESDTTVSESPIVNELDLDTGSNSANFLQSDEAALCSVECANVVAANESGTDLVPRRNAEEQNVEKVDKVETVHYEGGDDVFLPNASAGTTDATHQSDSSEQSCEQFSSVKSPVSTLKILASSTQNLKPILKRKDLNEKVSNSPQTTTLPPILKKRDSFNDTSEQPLSVSNDSSQVKPASILKNHNPRGSYSFDENINGSDVSIPADADKLSSLRPILKNKSWSTEERLNSGLSRVHSSDGVKGILKPIEKSTASSSSSSTYSLKSSVIDDSVSSSCSLPSSQPKTSVSLKSILKTPLNNRSSSLSPCNSIISLVDENDSIRVSSSASLIKSAFLQNSTLEEESTSLQAASICANDSDHSQNVDLDDSVIYSDFGNLQSSVSTPPVNNIKPILKKSTPSASATVQIGGGNNRNCNISLCQAECVSVGECSATMDHSSSTDSVSNNDISDKSSPSTECGENSSMPLSDSNVTLRKKSDNADRIRPKSCMVGSELQKLNVASSSDTPKISIKSSISERVAKLKQNGQEGWKSRIQKSDNDKEVKETPGEITLRSKEKDNKSNGIANRLSSLMESQSQWRSRVSDTDAKQFTVASKLTPKNVTQTSSSEKQTTSSDKVTLRDTPKRIGLRGSSLNERSLNLVSSKLNSVFSGDKSPMVKSKKDVYKPETLFEDKTLSLLVSNPTEELKNDPVLILRPDDDESFGSFFGFDNTIYDEIISRKPDGNSDSSIEFISMDCIQPKSLPLLSDRSKIRIQAPKRRAASNRNPVKMLAQSSIAVDSYGHKINSPISTPPPQSPSANSSGKFTQNLALSALAGLASTEDFKSVANKLRNSSASVSNLSNDAWRTCDIKNSMQSKMLILVKGRRKAQIRLVEPTWRSLSLVDSFVLVTKDNVFGFVGPLSNIIERTKCIEVAELIRKRKDLCYRSNSNELILVDGHIESVKSNLYEVMLPLLKELNFEQENEPEFDEIFNQDRVNPTLDDDDEYYEECMIGTNMIYKVVLDDTKPNSNAELIAVEKYWGRSPRHELLNPDCSFVFDYGTEMYVWIGKSISNLLRKKAVEAAKTLWYKGFDYSELDISPFGTNSSLKSDKRPDWAWFSRANQNMEPILFKDKFFNWPAFTLTRSVKRNSQKSISSLNDNHKKLSQSLVKKDLSEELNIFPVNVEKEMINKPVKEPNLVLEGVSIGRGACDIIKDEDGLSVKVVSLEVQCFYIDDFGDKVELLAMDSKFLFSAESYYIRWKYRLTRISRNLKTGGESRYSEQHGGRDRLCYFVWQGKDARNTQRGTTALNAIEKLRVEGASQVYVEYGNENPVFLRIFDGSLVIQLGKRKQVARNKHFRMFTMKCTSADETFLLELDCSIKNLRSRASFIFINPQCSNKIFIWHGCKVLEEKRDLMKQFLEHKLLPSKSKEFGFTESNSDFVILEIDEGKECKDFLEIFNFGDSLVHSPSKRASKSNLHREIYFSLFDDSRLYDFTPRLFHFITSSEKVFEAIEILPSYVPSPKSKVIIDYPFCQEDIYERAKTRPTFFLFDNHHEVYLWESKFPFFISSNKNLEENKSIKNAPQIIDIDTEIQSEMNTTTGFLSHLWQAERKCALESTLAYCHTKNSSQPPTAYVISAGLEPDSFCGLFPTWTYYDNVAQIHIEDNRKPGEQILVQEVLAQIRDINKSTYSYEELKRRPLLEGINILCLESYLDDSEFEKIFSMNREEFYSLPTWKQKIIKQEKELF